MPAFSYTMEDLGCLFSSIIYRPGGSWVSDQVTRKGRGQRERRTLSVHCLDSYPQFLDTGFGVLKPSRELGFQIKWLARNGGWGKEGLGPSSGFEPSVSRSRVRVIEHLATRASQCSAFMRYNRHVWVHLNLVFTHCEMVSIFVVVVVKSSPKTGTHRYMYTYYKQQQQSLT